VEISDVRGIAKPIKLGDEKFDLILNIMVGIKKSVASLVDMSSLAELNEYSFRMKNKMQN
jgi:hypothetical protein